MNMILAPRLRVSQLADLWGVSSTHIYSLIESGKLRAIRIGSAIRLRPEDIQEYEAASCPDPAPIDQSSVCSFEEGNTTFSGGKMGQHGAYQRGRTIAAKQKSS